MSIRTMFKSRTAVAKDIISSLMVMVTELRGDHRFSVNAPEFAHYLHNKASSDLVNAVEGCQSLYEQAQGPMSLANPEIISQCREVLQAELRRRG